MSATTNEASLAFIAWSRLFSPLAPEEWREEACQALGLPFDESDGTSAFWSVFVVGLPAPEVPLLLHAALGRDGGVVREDWMRVISHLGLTLGERSLPPDHLGAACEVLACAIEAEEPVLIRELCRRYLIPWSEVAHARLSQREDSLANLPRRFEHDLRELHDAHELSFNE
jgi:hypothetical protein